MRNFQQDLADYICSGHALLSVDTFEKDRAITEIGEVTKKIDRELFIWSVATGWKDKDGKSIGDVAVMSPVEDHVQAMISFDEGAVCVFRDFGPYLDNKTYPNYDVVIGWLDELKKIISSVRQTIIFVGPELQVPKSLLHDITRIDFDLPDKDQISDRIEFACGDVVMPDGSKFQPNMEYVQHIINACRGMTSQQIVDRVTLALRKHKDLTEESIQTILTEKAAVIRASGILSYIEPPKGGLGIVGGYGALKNHIILDKPCFTEDAREFGIEFPRGIMLVGIPGCGKTLLSLAISSELGLPCITMDIGNLMDKYVGESESNMREAIKMLESMAPCVLVLDEIEKGFGGDGNTDGGASRRVFGTFIKWLNDRTSPVYIVATANQVQSLPPEFCRKGRFDEIYGLDLPNKEERKEIFTIHISKRNRDTNKFDINHLASVTDGYTGADIEQIIRLGLKIAFGDRENLLDKHLINAVDEIIPLSKTESNRISEIRQWCEKHAKSAQPDKTNDVFKAIKRKVEMN